MDSVPDISFYFEALLQSLLTPETAGRPNVVLDLRSAEWTVGRFGWKAGIGSLFDFAADAYKDEMGITVPGSIRDEDGRLVSEENAPQGDVTQLAFNLVESPNVPCIERPIVVRVKNPDGYQFPVHTRPKTKLAIQLFARVGIGVESISGVKLSPSL